MQILLLLLFFDINPYKGFYFSDFPITITITITILKSRFLRHQTYFEEREVDFSLKLFFAKLIIKCFPKNLRIFKKKRNKWPAKDPFPLQAQIPSQITINMEKLKEPLTRIINPTCFNILVMPHHLHLNHQLLIVKTRIES